MGRAARYTHHSVKEWSRCGNAHHKDCIHDPTPFGDASFGEDETPYVKKKPSSVSRASRKGVERRPSRLEGLWWWREPRVEYRSNTPCRTVTEVVDSLTPEQRLALTEQYGERVFWRDINGYGCFHTPRHRAIKHLYDLGVFERKVNAHYFNDEYRLTEFGRRVQDHVSR